MHYSRILSENENSVQPLFLFSGSNASVLIQTQPDTDFSDASEVKNFIQLKGYFQGSHGWCDHVLGGIAHHDLALQALGGLANHLSRLMVSISNYSCVLCKNIFLFYVCFDR